MTKSVTAVGPATPASKRPAATCLAPNPSARLRLFCFPYAGGGAWAYSGWPRGLPADIGREVEVWAVNLPGRDTAAGVCEITDMPRLIDKLHEGVLPLLRAPYVFFGHSMGALLSFETALVLSADGGPGPAHVVVSGYRAPHLPDRHPAVHDVDDEKLVARLRRLGGTPEACLADPEWRALMLPVIRSDLGLCETYTYADRGRLACPVTALGGDRDRLVAREELEAWRVHTASTFSLRVLPGGHFYLETARPLTLRLLGRELRSVLRTASSVRPEGETG